jgi:hypothetical protein
MGIDFNKMKIYMIEVVIISSDNSEFKTKTHFFAALIAG